MQQQPLVTLRLDFPITLESFYPIIEKNPTHLKNIFGANYCHLSFKCLSRVFEKFDRLDGVYVLDGLNKEKQVRPALRRVESNLYRKSEISLVGKIIPRIDQIRDMFYSDYLKGEHSMPVEIYSNETKQFEDRVTLELKKGILGRPSVSGLENEYMLKRTENGLGVSLCQIIPPTNP